MTTFEDIKQANTLIKTTDIKGKDYAEVPQRIKAFRYLHPEGAIITELLSNEDGVCVFRATVMNGEGKILGTGTAYEKESSSYINKTSYIENCETSAVGRALGMCGLGIDTSIASYEEVANAIRNQEAKPVMVGQTDDNPLGAPICENCGKAMTKTQETLSMKKYGKRLCPACQK